MEYLHKELTERIIGCYYEVYKTLGFGFLEKVYQRAMILELKGSGLSAESQCPIRVHYKGEVVGDYFADLVVEKSVIVELKAAESVIEEHELQLINYLKATDIEIGLLLNFGKAPAIRRKIFSNDRKWERPNYERR